jgi:hypothetical protein
MPAGKRSLHYLEDLNAGRECYQPGDGAVNIEGQVHFRPASATARPPARPAAGLAGG